MAGAEGLTILRVNCGELTMKLTVRGSVNILTVKETIKDTIGTEVARQTLYSDSNFSEVLPDGKTIFPSGNVIFLRVQPLPADATIKITVFHLATHYQQDFEVKETDTVMSLKRKIRLSPQFTRKITEYKLHEKPEYVLPQDLGLIRKDINVVLKEDDYSLTKYCIHDGCKMDIHISIIAREGPNLSDSLNSGVRSEQGSTSFTSDSINKSGG